MVIETKSPPAVAESPHFAPSYRKDRRESEDFDTAESPKQLVRKVFPSSRWLVAIIVTFAGLSIFYNLTTPIGEGPDEQDHIRYVEHLVRFYSLPDISIPEGSDRPYTIEAKQPPLYYMMQAGLMLALGRGGNALAPELPEDKSFGPKKTDDDTRYDHPPVPMGLLPWTYIMRLFSMLFGIPIILLVFATTREVFSASDHEPLAVGAAAATGLLPQFTFMFSVVNNDHLAILVGVAISYYLVRILKRGANWRRTAKLGLLLGLALWTKNNNLVFIPVGLFVLVLSGLPGRFTYAPNLLRKTWRSWIAKHVGMILLASALCVIVGGWWMLRHQLIYGDPFARDAINQMAARVFPGYDTGYTRSDPGDLVTQVIFMIGTHFGAFGFMAVLAPAILYNSYITLILLSMVGLLAAMARRKMSGVQAACLMLGILTLELFYAAMVYYGVWESRLLYPTLALTSMLLVSGMYYLVRVLLPKNSEFFAATVSAIIWVVFMGASNIYMLLAAQIPAFYGKL